MKNTPEVRPTAEKTLIKPFHVKQAIAGLEMKQTDQQVLKYLNFLSGLIPLDAVYFLHLIPSFGLFSHLFVENANLISEQQVQKEKLLKEMVNKIHLHFPKRQNINLDHEVRGGDPLEELLKSAKKIEADLVVIGQKMKAGRHGILAKRLARLVKSNAIIIPKQAKHSLKKILVPVDFSPHSLKALQTAIAISQQLDDPIEIVCLHIYEIPDYAASMKEFRETIEQDKKLKFEAFVQPYLSAEKGAIRTVLLQKEFPTRKPRYIMDYAQEHEIDFILIGAIGHSKAERIMMGSVTEKLLSINDSIPTLVVKIPDGDNQ